MFISPYLKGVSEADFVHLAISLWMNCSNSLGIVGIGSTRCGPTRCVFGILRQRNQFVPAAKLVPRSVPDVRVVEPSLYCASHKAVPVPYTGSVL